MNRRSFLSGAGFIISALFAGCLSAIDDNENSQRTEELQIRFWLEEVSLSASKQDAVNPIVFGDLSAGEQEIVQTALEGDYTAEKGTESPALEELRDCIEQRTGNGQTLEAYFRRNDTYYRIGFADGDHIISHPDR